MILALTGGTGFVGRATINHALATGHQIRALTRRPQPSRDGVTWVAGALDDPASMATLVAGSEAVIHIAGVVNAADRAGFVAGNVAGTRAMLAANPGCVANRDSAARRVSIRGRQAVDAKLRTPGRAN